MKRFFVVVFCLFAGALHAQNMNWEEPRLFSTRSGSFPVSDYRGRISAVAWQEAVRGDSGGAINVNLAIKQGSDSWIIRENIASYPYFGAEPAILSITVDTKGRILLAAAASPTVTNIFIIADPRAEFIQYPLVMGAENSFAPRIFTRADGGYILFVTRSDSQRNSLNNLSLYYARSEDGISWSNFQPFITEQDKNIHQNINVLPCHAAFNGRDYVIFQSRTENPNFQLYIKSSGDNGRSWSNSTRVTNFPDPVPQNVLPDQADNQRVHLSVLQNRLFAVWERHAPNKPPQIYGTWLNIDGSLSGAPFRINFDDAYCNNPIAFEYKGNAAVIWFDNSQGPNRVMYSDYSSGGWSRGTDLSRGAGGETSFGRPVVSGDSLSMFWQSTRQNQNRIYSMALDTSVAQPQVLALNFTSGKPTRSDTAFVTWIPPRSGAIQGYAWSWSKNAEEQPPPKIMSYTVPSSPLEQNVSEDGVWYFSLIAQDYAGTWSDPVQLAFFRSTALPPPPEIIAPEFDDSGYLLSNTFSMRWNTPLAPDLAGYTWNLEYLGIDSFVEGTGVELNAQAAERFRTFVQPPRIILGQGNSAAFVNQNNGLWVFSVCTIDQMGNISPAARYFFKTNKFLPFTSVSFVNARRNDDGNIVLHILGRGFTEQGMISRIIIDRDGQEPYDGEYFLYRGEYNVVSDREISGLVAGDLPEGVYRVHLEHPQRGIYVSPPVITVEKTGTVKFGDYTQTWQPSWSVREGRKFTVDTAFLMLGAVLIFCILGIIAAVKGLSNAAAESTAIRKETIALITGDIMPWDKKNRMTRIKRRVGGLRTKMASFTIVLVILVVVMISVPLYTRMGHTQEATLLRSLYDRSAVLMEGIATGANAYLPSQEEWDKLLPLPRQSAGIPEALYVTITGYGIDDNISPDYVLASNEASLSAKLLSGELIQGTYVLNDPLSPRIPDIVRECNESTWDAISTDYHNINELTNKAKELLDSPQTAETIRLGNEIADQLQFLQDRVDETLTQIGRKLIGSQPNFSISSLKNNTADTYIFYKPIMYRLGTDTLFYRGMVRMEVTIDSIKKDIEAERWATLRDILPWVLAAIALGAVGALILSTLIIRPISRLVSHVERIRDTEDKAKLDGVEIEINSKDEIAVLGKTINDMTYGLVKAAIAASDLSMGKEIQKKFIPLELNREGDKLTSGFKDAKNVQFFGYYEGAKGVSGDYFDYRDLDGRYYAIIKCDVAGKGIPAALIMIQVATMFLSYFRRWSPTERNMHIEDLVYQINDFIETLGFKGRFAAFTLCLFDSQTGVVRFCNAGDNLIHLFDASEGKLKTLTLPETPATGVLPNFLVESKGGYKVQTMTLDRGDILLLYTDGIEEAKRKFRDADFREIICVEGEK
ncbi:MAG: SpoIIE family protein phosphatase, partial [Spirochaetaceae bacterium]|nr:SpoIIE family protein phosphatase [Spirochaetaceae bacterium]